MTRVAGLLAWTGVAITSVISVVMTQTAPTRPLAEPLHGLDDALLQWPLSAGDTAYGSIDGRRLHQVVDDFAAIARRYRDAGHAQYWGRIIGTSADDESARYLVDRFKQLGLIDVRLQSFDLPPQWMPQTWTITATGAGKTVKLEAAQPVYGTPATTADGLEAELVWAGTGTEADYLGRDVRGKVVVITRGAGTNPRLAETRGALALLVVNPLPGNIKNQVYPIGTSVPTFTVGTNDGIEIRDLISKAGSDAPHVKVRLDVRTLPAVKSATVWGTLPGATDETIYVLAHRDGWFEGASDNASGVATMIGLAEYFARIPVAQRRRTIVFLGSSGHHNSTDTAGFSTGRSNVSGTWLLQNRDSVFAKTALFINCEHTATPLTFVQAAQNRVRRGNTYTALQWYAGGPSRPKLQDLSVKAFKDFGVATYAEPERGAPNGEAGGLWPYVPVVQASDYNTYFHTDADTAETVPWTGLESVTRAYAKIIDGVNRLNLTDLQRAPDVTPTNRR